MASSTFFSSCPRITHGRLRWHPDVGGPAFCVIVAAHVWHLAPCRGPTLSLRPVSAARWPSFTSPLQLVVHDGAMPRHYRLFHALRHHHGSQLAPELHVIMALELHLVISARARAPPKHHTLLGPVYRPAPSSPLPIWNREHHCCSWSFFLLVLHLFFISNAHRWSSSTPLSSLRAWRWLTFVFLVFHVVFGLWCSHYF